MPKPYRVCVLNMITMITVITKISCHAESGNLELICLIDLTSMLYDNVYSLAVLGISFFNCL